MLQCVDEKSIIRRLKRIEGQVRGFVRMVEEDKPCKNFVFSYFTSHFINIICHY